MITPIKNDTTKPQFNSKLVFPVSDPFYNDKILIRVWDHRTGFKDRFIANIPENVTDDDYFNLTYLQSRGCYMPLKWFNLYSIPGDERDNIFDLIRGQKKVVEGTQF